VAGENWTAAKKPSDKSPSRLPSLPDFNSSVSNAASAVNALNGVLKRLMTLGEINLYNYSGGMPALYGTSAGDSGSGFMNGSSLPKAEPVNGFKANGFSCDNLQVGTEMHILCL
jgi:hypothetical protein